MQFIRFPKPYKLIDLLIYTRYIGDVSELDA